jgi:PadR family transcriptional regulator PadR
MTKSVNDDDQTMSAGLAKIMAVYKEYPNGEFTGSEVMEMTGMRSGSVYPGLARLVTRKWVKARWEIIDPKETTRPQRRLYRATKGGHRVAITSSVVENLPASDQRAPKLA